MRYALAVILLPLLAFAIPVVAAYWGVNFAVTYCYICYTHVTSFCGRMFT